MPEFSLLGLAAHLAAAHAEMKHAEHTALEQAARLIEARAKAELGTYQEAAGPFAPWAELADSTKADRARHGYSEDEPGLRTGEMRDSIGHEVGDREAVIGSNDQSLVYFELGTEKQPPRSVLGSAAVTEAPKVAELLGGAVVKTLFGRAVIDGSMPIP